MDVYKNKVRVAAHRGNSRWFPENTLVAFESAFTLPVDQMEIDLHMTKDGEIVMMHDHAVDRTTNGTGLVRDLTLKEIKALDAGAWKGDEFIGTRVPTFIEFLEFIKDHPEMTYNVELKDYPLTDPEWAKVSADKSLALIEKYGIADRIWINCWSTSTPSTITATSSTATSPSICSTAPRPATPTTISIAYACSAPRSSP